MAQMLIFGTGYAASHLAGRLCARGWEVAGTTTDGRAGSIAFGDERAVYAALQGATHILSSVPPTEGGAPVLARYGEAIAIAPRSEERRVGKGWGRQCRSRRWSCHHKKKK